MTKMSGRGGDGGEDPDPPKGPPGGGGPTINGSIEAMLTPELLFRMNKKIAQLTKVVYGLNTRGEELESQLASVREAEENLKSANAELQHRATHYKLKYDSEIGKLRDMEQQVTQAQYWKMECENLKRRLDLEGGMGMMGGADVRAAVAAAREDTDRALRREKAVTYELEQARQAITNLKSHHDFIMRERDAQLAMEREKMELEWQTRLTEVENRYKGQTRRVQDDLEVLTAECEILRRRNQDSQDGETTLREQMIAQQRDHDRMRREWELKIQMKEQDAQDAALKFSQEKRDYEVKLRNLEEERRIYEEDWEEKLREKEREAESKLREAMRNQEMMQRLIDDKEEEFETRLKAQVVQWKTDWDNVEEGLKDEIKKLKTENDNLRSEAGAMRGRVDRAEIEHEMRIQELEQELGSKNTELENRTKNLKIRLETMENSSRQQNQEKLEVERLLREDREKLRQLQLKLDTLEASKQSSERRVLSLSSTERDLRESKETLSLENEELRVELEGLKTKMEAKEKEWAAKMEAEAKAAESRVKQRIEKTWLDKLKRSEESAAQDIEKLRESHRRSESDLKKELGLAQKAEEETKRLNEEFKKKVKALRQSETDLGHKVKELEDRLEKVKRRGEVLTGNEFTQELVAQEERYQKQVDQLTISLAEKQQELSRLTQQLEEVKRTYVDPVEMQRKMDEMQLEVREQVGQSESLKVELQYSKNEVELHKMRLQRLEEDLEAAKEKNQSLQTQLAAENKSDRIEELELRLRVMDERLRAGQQDKEKLNKQILEMEAERDEEIKIIQDALDEAAAEREELIATFEKELQNMTTMNSTREQQLMEDFEWKLREMEKDHKKKLEERERKAESTLVRAKRHQEEAEAEFRQKQEKMKNELNAEWEDKLRSECSRLKGELDGLHAEEKHLAVESMKVQKEQEIRALKQSWELRQEEMTKEISTLKDSLTEKDAYYHKEMENMRTIADRDIWELRRKYQKLDEKSWSQMENLQEKHREEMDRLREEHEERVKELEARLNAATCQLPDDDARVQLEKMYKDQVEHLTDQQTHNMERLREELEAEKFRAVEEARVLVSKHLEYVNATLREQLTEAVTSNNIYRQESEAMRMALQRREEVIQSLEEDMAKLKAEYGLNKSPSHPHYMASQSSLASSNDSSSTSSSNSQDRVSLSESIGASAEEETPKSGGSGLLGKVFGGGWFGSSKAKETPRRGSAPSTGNQSKST